jgi:hypothetical protein
MITEISLFIIARTAYVIPSGFSFAFSMVVTVIPPLRGLAFPNPEGMKGL